MGNIYKLIGNIYKLISMYKLIKIKSGVLGLSSEANQNFFKIISGWLAGMVT